MATRSRKSTGGTILIAVIDFWIGNIMYSKDREVRGLDPATVQYLLDHNYVVEKEVRESGSEYGD